MASLIELHEVAAQTPEGRILFSGLSLSLNPGDLLLIEGGNGSGKTTLVQMILGLRLVGMGRIDRRVANDQISYLAQLGNMKFFLPLTIQDVINLKNPFSDADILSVGLLKKESLGLAWNTASGGERQKALLTRAMLHDAKLIVLDEPFNHIDKVTRRLITSLIRGVLQKGAAVILISHDPHIEGLAPTRVVHLDREGGEA